MNILLTGANGYIGLRLLSSLLAQGHLVTAVVRDPRRFPLSDFPDMAGQLELVEGNFSDPENPPQFARSYDAAYYLIHATRHEGDPVQQETNAARAFVRALPRKRCKRIIALSPLLPDVPKHSQHHKARLAVEDILRAAKCPVTILRSAPIIGSGSSSFEIIRDLTEQCPLLLAPRWMHRRCRPIAIRNVIDYLTGALDVAGGTYAIEGPETLSLIEMIRCYAELRELRRGSVPVPFHMGWLSTHAVSWNTSVTKNFARDLVDTLKQDCLSEDHRLAILIPTPLLTYREAVHRALARIAQNRVPSSWLNSLNADAVHARMMDCIKAPEHGVYQLTCQENLTCTRTKLLKGIWSLGGANGWPSMNVAWKLRGAFDQLIGGCGSRRGRPNSEELRPGDALDFWRVMLADRRKGRLLLYAELRMPGEAWLELSLVPTEERSQEALRETFTFRPRGIIGRLYWMATLPFHKLLFGRMTKRLAETGGAIAKQPAEVPAGRDPWDDRYYSHDLRPTSAPRRW